MELLLEQEDELNNDKTCFKCGNIWRKGHDFKTKQDKKDQPDLKDSKTKRSKEETKKLRKENKCFNFKSAWQPGHKCKELNSTQIKNGI